MSGRLHAAVRPSSSVVDPMYVEEHQRLLAGHPDARERLAAALLRDVPRYVRFRYLTDAGTVAEAVADATLRYLTHPERFDPTRRPLPVYVARFATNLLIDRHRHECK